MRIVERVILMVGAATMVVLLLKLDAATVWSYFLQVGWGMALLMALHAADHVINALAWRFAFAPEEAARLKLRALIIARIAGDGVNYLTPSATIAGEIVRPGMVAGQASAGAKVASVVIAKFSQSLGQALFILCGIVYIVLAGIPVSERFHGWFYLAVGCLGAVFAGLIVYAVMVRQGGPVPVATETEDAAGSWTFKSFKAQMGRYFRRHPGRLAASILLFALGYLWGVIEAYLICFFLGLPITAKLAFAIEVMSSAVDGIFFMVPAKMGTQEAGKTAIFAGLGLPPASGFAFGLVRHLRELAWAFAGFALFTIHRRSSARREQPLSGAEPVHRASREPVEAPRG